MSATPRIVAFEPRHSLGVAAILKSEIVRGFAHFGTEPPSPETVEQTWAKHAARCPWFVALGEDESVLGHASSGPWKSRQAYAWSVEVGVHVAEAARGWGIGKALYTRLFAELEARGFRLALAGIALPNDASVRLHEAMGMNHAGTLPGVGYKLDAWRDVGYWVRPLGAGSNSPPGAEPLNPTTDSPRSPG